MSKIKKFFRVKNNAEAKEQWIDLMEWLGIDKSNGQALSEATYYACLKILSEAVAKLPLKLMQKTKKQGVIEATAHPYYRVLRSRPNKYMNSTIFMGTVEQLRNHYGNAYVYISGYGDNMQLIPLESDKVQVVYDDGKILSEVPDIHYLYSVGGKQYRFTSEEILHFKTSSTFDGIIGKSVKNILETTINGNIKSQNMVNKLIDSGFTAKAVVQYTGNLKDEGVKSFLQNIANYAKGDVDLGKGLIPIPIGANLQPLTTKLGDNEFLEIKKFTATQICSAFGIKPVQVNDYSKSSYSSAEAQNLAFLTDTLSYILKQYEEELNYKLLTDKEIKKGYFFKFNVGALLRTDLQTQMNSLSVAVANGIYTPNEARAYLDMETKEGCDDLMCNGSNVKVKDLGIQYTNEPPTSTTTEGGVNNE